MSFSLEEAYTYLQWLLVVRNSLSAVAGDFVNENESLWLNCDAVTDGEQTGLVFPVGGSSFASEKGNLELFAARNTIWGPSGVARAWNSYSLDHVPEHATKGYVNCFVGLENHKINRNTEMW